MKYCLSTSGGTRCPFVVIGSYRCSSCHAKNNDAVGTHQRAERSPRHRVRERWRPISGRGDVINGGDVRHRVRERWRPISGRGDVINGGDVRHPARQRWRPISGRGDVINGGDVRHPARQRWRPISGRGDVISGSDDVTACNLDHATRREGGLRHQRAVSDASSARASSWRRSGRRNNHRILKRSTYRSHARTPCLWFLYIVMNPFRMFTHTHTTLM